MNAVSDFWKAHAPTIDAERFRASPHFLDARGYPYADVVEILRGRGIHPHHLVERFGGEDGAFGCETERIACGDRSPTVVVSRELCGKYLRFRKAARYRITAPSELASETPTIANMFDLAVNIHSWSECDLPAIVWWLELLDRRNVRRLFIVPHWLELCAYSAEHGGGCGDSYREELERRGWRETARWSRMLEPVHFSKHYYLFQR